MLLSEAKQLLKKNGFRLVEDTDDWDEADMPAGMSAKERREMARKHNANNGVRFNPYTHMSVDYNPRSIEKKAYTMFNRNNEFKNLIYSTFDPENGGFQGWTCKPYKFMSFGRHIVEDKFAWVLEKEDSSIYMVVDYMHDFTEDYPKPFYADVVVWSNDAKLLDKTNFEASKVKELFEKVKNKVISFDKKYN